MLSIAYIGFYWRCAPVNTPKIWVHLGIWVSSAAAALATSCLLAGVWMLFQYLKNSQQIETTQHWLDGHDEKIVFIVGVPLVLECVSIAVVIRMAIMGKLFPDERREWWGKMGAVVHRALFFWLLATTASLVLPYAFRLLTCDENTRVKLTAFWASWGAIIGGAVKLAYTSKDDGTKGSAKSSIATDVIMRVAPYLFMLGFILIGAWVLDQLIEARENPWGSLIVTTATAIVTLLLSWRVGVNEFSLHHFYRNRLVRAYMGASRKRTDRDRTANSFTGFDKDDDIKLSTFITTSDEAPYCGPYPILNAALNSTKVSELDRQDRKAESFVFTPLYCGFDFSPTRSAAYAKNNVYEYGYRPTYDYAYKDGPMIGTAMAISGAAANPNMGYHSSAATAFLLTMFNVRLGWWMGNPRKDKWKESDPGLGIAYLVKDLVGNSDIDSGFVCLSDGGHFDNMGLYELVRRRVTNITLVDAEEDNGATCEGLANAIRRCRIDFGVEISITTDEITKKDESGFSKAHKIFGIIKYPGIKEEGLLTYIKTTLVGNETTDVRQYKLNNPLFPQQPTSDQFFTEEQFESYRKLGYLSA